MKKFLSLLLAVVMTMSLVTISAGATEFKDLTDKDELGPQYEEAVAVLNKIGVITGYDDGSFKPDVKLTRGAAAKIIVSLLIGPEAASNLPNNRAPYPDVPASHTFAGVIAYCQTAGIISGYGDGTFKPGNDLTGYAFAKMLLCALGYDATIERFVGTGWTNNVLTVGQSATLFDRLDFKGAESVTRKDAALLAMNTLKATTVEYRNGQNIHVTADNGTTVNLTATPSATYVTSNQDYARNILSQRRDIRNENNSRADYNTVEFAEQHFVDLRLTHDKYSPIDDDYGRPSAEWSYKKLSIGKFPLVPDFEYTTQVTHDVKTTTPAAKIRALGLNGYYVDNGTRLWRNGVEYDIDSVDAIADLTDNGTLVEVYVDNNGADYITDVVVIKSQLMAVKRVGSDYVSLELYKEGKGSDDKTDKKTEVIYGFNQHPIDEKIANVDVNDDFYTMLSGLKVGDKVVVEPLADNHSATADYLVGNAYVPETVVGSLNGVPDRFGSASDATQKNYTALSVDVGGTTYKVSLWNKDLTGITPESIKVTKKDVTLTLDQYGNAMLAQDVGDMKGWLIVGNYRQSIVNGILVTFANGWDLDGKEVSLNIGARAGVTNWSNVNSVSDDVWDTHGLPRIGSLVKYSSDATSNTGEWTLSQSNASGVYNVYNGKRNAPAEATTIGDATNDYYSIAANSSAVTVDNSANGEAYREAQRAATKPTDTFLMADNIKFIYVTADDSGELDTIEVKSGRTKVTIEELNGGSTVSGCPTGNPFVTNYSSIINTDLYTSVLTSKLAKGAGHFRAQAAVEPASDTKIINENAKVKAVVIKRENGDASFKNLLYVVDYEGSSMKDAAGQMVQGYKVAMLDDGGSVTIKTIYAYRTSLQPGNFAKYRKSTHDDHPDDFYTLRRYAANTCETAGTGAAIVQLANIDSFKVANNKLMVVKNIVCSNGVGHTTHKGYAFSNTYESDRNIYTEAIGGNTGNFANNMVDLRGAKWVDLSDYKFDIESADDLQKAWNETKGDVSVTLLFNDDHIQDDGNNDINKGSDNFRSVYLIVVNRAGTQNVVTDQVWTVRYGGHSGVYSTDMPRTLAKGDVFGVWLENGYAIKWSDVRGVRYLGTDYANNSEYGYFFEVYNTSNVYIPVYKLSDSESYYNVNVVSGANTVQGDWTVDQTGPFVVGTRHTITITAAGANDTVNVSVAGGNYEILTNDGKTATVSVNAAATITVTVTKGVTPPTPDTYDIIVTVDGEEDEDLSQYEVEAGEHDIDISDILGEDVSATYSVDGSEPEDVPENGIITVTVEDADVEVEIFTDGYVPADEYNIIVTVDGEIDEELSKTVEEPGEYPIEFTIPEGKTATYSIDGSEPEDVPEDGIITVTVVDADVEVEIETKDAGTVTPPPTPGGHFEVGKLPDGTWGLIWVEDAAVETNSLNSRLSARAISYAAPFSGFETNKFYDITIPDVGTVSVQCVAYGNTFALKFSPKVDLETIQEIADIANETGRVNVDDVQPSEEAFAMIGGATKVPVYAETVNDGAAPFKIEDAVYVGTANGKATLSAREGYELYVNDELVTGNYIPKEGDVVSVKKAVANDGDDVKVIDRNADTLEFGAYKTSASQKVELDETMVRNALAAAGIEVSDIDMTTGVAHRADGKVINFSYDGSLGSTTNPHRLYKVTLPSGNVQYIKSEGTLTGVYGYEALMVKGTVAGAVNTGYFPVGDNGEVTVGVLTKDVEMVEALVFTSGTYGAVAGGQTRNQIKASGTAGEAIQFGVYYTKDGARHAFGTETAIEKGATLMFTQSGLTSAVGQNITLFVNGQAVANETVSAAGSCTISYTPTSANEDGKLDFYLVAGVTVKCDDDPEITGKKIGDKIYINVPDDDVVLVKVGESAGKETLTVAAGNDTPVASQIEYTVTAGDVEKGVVTLARAYKYTAPTSSEPWALFMTKDEKGDYKDPQVSANLAAGKTEGYIRAGGKVYVRAADNNTILKVADASASKFTLTADTKKPSTYQKGEWILTVNGILAPDSIVKGYGAPTSGNATTAVEVVADYSLESVPTSKTVHFTIANDKFNFPGNVLPTGTPTVDWKAIDGLTKPVAAWTGDHTGSMTITTTATAEFPDNGNIGTITITWGDLSFEVMLKTFESISVKVNGGWKNSTEPLSSASATNITDVLKEVVPGLEDTTKILKIEDGVVTAANVLTTAETGKASTLTPTTEYWTKGYYEVTKVISTSGKVTVAGEDIKAEIVEPTANGVYYDQENFTSATKIYLTGKTDLNVKITGTAAAKAKITLSENASFFTMPDATFIRKSATPQTVTLACKAVPTAGNSTTTFTVAGSELAAFNVNGTEQVLSIESTNLSSATIAQVLAALETPITVEGTDKLLLVQSADDDVKLMDASTVVSSTYDGVWTKYATVACAALTSLAEVGGVQSISNTVTPDADEAVADGTTATTFYVIPGASLAVSLNSTNQAATGKKIKITALGLKIGGEDSPREFILTGSATDTTLDVPSLGEDGSFMTNPSVTVGAADTSSTT